MRYLSRLALFALKTHPLWLLGMLVGVASVAIELAAIASLQPLLQVASSGLLPPDSRWRAVLAAFSAQPTLANLIGLFCALFLIRVAMLAANLSVGAWVGRTVQADLSSRVFGRVVTDISLADVELQTIGHYISLGGDETARAGSILVTINQLVAQVVLASVYFMAVFLMSPIAAMWVLGFLAVTLAALTGAFRESQRLGAEQLRQARGAHSIFLDALNGLRSVRAFGAERYVVGSYRKTIHDYVRLNFRIDFLNLLSRSIPAIILLVLVIWWSTQFLGESTSVDIPRVVTVSVLLLRFLPAASQCLNLSLRLYTDSRAAKSVFDVVAQGASDGRLARPVPSQPVRSIRFDRVSFGYDKEHLVLRDISLDLRAGRSYAIVGPSGTGKSTLLDLMLGFREPDAGRIEIGDQEIRDLDTSWLRRHLVLVPQHTTFLHDTVRRNVVFGAEYSADAVEFACKLACAHDFIAQLPGGYETLISYQGGNLSGGQRQRLGIARALLRSPDVLLFDESTSALDTDTAERILDNVFSAFPRAILLFVTHDPRVMRRVDEVIELRLHLRDGVPDAAVLVGDGSYPT